MLIIDKILILDRGKRCLPASISSLFFTIFYPFSLSILSLNNTLFLRRFTLKHIYLLLIEKIYFDKYFLIVDKGRVTIACNHYSSSSLPYLPFLPFTYFYPLFGRLLKISLPFIKKITMEDIFYLLLKKRPMASSYSITLPSLS